MFVKNGIILFLLFLGLIKPLNPLIQIANLAYASLLGSFVISTQFFKIKLLQKTTLILVSLLLLIYTIAATILSNELKNTQLKEPVNEKYEIDTQIFLKTYYLMEKGQGYYRAFASAFILDSRFEQVPKDSYAWRFPTTFYFWKLVAQNGYQIRIIFLTLSVMSLFCSYLLVKKFVPPPIALLSPYLTMPYFLSGVLSHSFLFIEWWGLFFFIFGLTFLFYNKRNISVFFLIVSVLCRELFIFPALVILIIDFLSRRKILHFATFLISSAAFWVLHLINISNSIGQANIAPQSRIHNFNFDLLLSVLSFSTGLFTHDFLIGVLFLVITTIGLARLRLQRKDKAKMLLFFASASVFILFLLTPIIGTAGTEKGISFYASFWGITFVPLAIIFSPTILSGSKKP